MVAPLTSDEPRTAGPYQLLEQLGRDGLGQVFLGRSETGERVVVRLIRAELAADPAFRARLRAEVDSARKVRGVLVAPVRDADLDSDVPWLATAFVAGQPLADAVREHGPMSGRSLLMLAAGLAESLGTIHAAGVVHGNLNPSHVVLAENGPWLTGFGLGRAAASGELLDEGGGSPGFLSPEQVLGQEAGPASDIFSLGAVLVFACRGQEPFGSGTSSALMYRLVNSPADLRSLPVELRRLVEGCLAKQPDARPTASRLRARLGGMQVVSGTQVAVGAPGAPGRTVAGKRAWGAFAASPPVLGVGPGMGRRRGAGRWRCRYRHRDRRPVPARRAGQVRCGRGGGGTGLDISGAVEHQLVASGTFLPRWPPALQPLGPSHPVGAAGLVLLLVPEPGGSAIRAPEFVRASVGVPVGVGVVFRVVFAVCVALAVDLVVVCVAVALNLVVVCVAVTFDLVVVCLAVTFNLVVVCLAVALDLVVFCVALLVVCSPSSVSPSSASTSATSVLPASP